MCTLHCCWGHVPSHAPWSCAPSSPQMRAPVIRGIRSSAPAQSIGRFRAVPAQRWHASGMLRRVLETRCCVASRLGSDGYLRHVHAGPVRAGHVWKPSTLRRPNCHRRKAPCLSRMAGMGITTICITGFDVTALYLWDSQYSPMQAYVR